MEQVLAAAAQAVELAWECQAAAALVQLQSLMVPDPAQAAPAAAQDRALALVWSAAAQGLEQERLAEVQLCCPVGQVPASRAAAQVLEPGCLAEVQLRCPLVQVLAQAASAAAQVQAQECQAAVAEDQLAPEKVPAMRAAAQGLALKHFAEARLRSLWERVWGATAAALAQAQGC